MIVTDKLNSLVIACLFLIQEREIEQQQEVTVVAAKVTHSLFLTRRYYDSVRDWLPNLEQYLTYEEIRIDPPSDN